MSTQQAEIPPYSIILVNEPSGRAGYRVGRMTKPGYMWDLAKGCHSLIESDGIVVLVSDHRAPTPLDPPEDIEMGSFLNLEAFYRDEMTGAMGQVVYADALYAALGTGVNHETPAEALALILEWTINSPHRFRYHRPRLPVLPLLVEWFEQLWLKWLHIEARNVRYWPPRPGGEVVSPPEWRQGLYYLVFGEPLIEAPV